ncbi:MAG: NAD-dependent epimerase/dehydratase family protein, partial [Candidatus Binatia bacterium]
MNEKIFLVTGATGFVARHLIQSLAQMNPAPRICALVRSAQAWKAMDWTREYPQVELIEGSVTDISRWEQDPRLKRLSGIFHLAAVIRHSRKDPKDIYQTNIEGLLNMVTLASDHRCRIVFVSTSGTVGCFDNARQWADEHSPYAHRQVGSWPYYDSKIQAERKARKLARKKGIDLVILRPPVLLGPGDHRYRATGHVLRHLLGKIPFLLKGGMHFVDVRDACQAIIRAMDIPAPKPIYHLVGTECTIDEFFQMVEEISGVPAPKLHLPIYLARIVSTATSQLEALLPKRQHTLLPDPV